MHASSVCWWFECGPQEAADVIDRGQVDYSPRIAIVARRPDPGASVVRNGPLLVFSAVPDDLDFDD